MKGKYVWFGTLREAVEMQKLAVYSNDAELSSALAVLQVSCVITLAPKLLFRYALDWLNDVSTLDCPLGLSSADKRTAGTKCKFLFSRDTVTLL